MNIHIQSIDGHTHPTIEGQLSLYRLQPLQPQWVLHYNFLLELQQEVKQEVSMLANAILLWISVRLQISLGVLSAAFRGVCECLFL